MNYNELQLLITITTTLVCVCACVCMVPSVRMCVWCIVCVYVYGACVCV